MSEPCCMANAHDQKCECADNRRIDEVQELSRMIAGLRDALHAAIAAPRGVVPDSAAPFYDPTHPALWRLNKEAR